MKLKSLDYIPFFSTFNGLIRFGCFVGLKGRIQEIAKQHLSVDTGSSSFSRLGRAVVTLLPGINLLTILYDFVLNEDPFSFSRISKMDASTRKFAEGVKQWRDSPDVVGNKRQAALQILKIYQEQGEVLNLVRYKLNSLPPELKEITSIKKLFLAHNHLTIVPDEIQYLKNLEVLHLDFNQITEFPSGLGKLTSLRVLSIFGNRYSILPDFICRIRCLEYLGFEKPSQGLPSWLKDLSHIKKIHMNAFENGYGADDTSFFPQGPELTFTNTDGTGVIEVGFGSSFL